MSVFRVKLAGIPVEVNAAFDSTKDFCKKYLTEETPHFAVSVMQKDIEKMRGQDRKTALAEGRTPINHSDSYLETLALANVILDKLIAQNILLFHGAVMALNGSAYLFTAKSGVGKTTHCKLWLKNIPGSYVLNGDKPLLLFKNGKVYACGSPWQGKENYGINEILPLKSVCIVERDTANHIKEIAPRGAFNVLMNQCNIPNGNGAMLTACSLIKQLSALKLFRLCCNMEDEAALVSYRGMVNE